MTQEERNRLTYELTEICRLYEPGKGPYAVEEVTQRFDLYQLDQGKQIAQQRAAVLEYAGQNPGQSLQAINASFDDKQTYVDGRIRDAYIATCQANQLPLPLPQDLKSVEIQQTQGHRVGEPVAFRSTANVDYNEIAQKGRLAQTLPPPGEDGGGNTPPSGGGNRQSDSQQKQPEKLNPENIPPKEMRQRFGYDPKAEAAAQPFFREKTISLAEFRAQQEQQAHTQQQRRDIDQQQSRGYGPELGL